MFEMIEIDFLYGLISIYYKWISSNDGFYSASFLAQPRVEIHSWHGMSG